MDNQKDKVAIEELKIVFSQLQYILSIAEQNIGKTRPIIYGGDIELVKDHLDLVVKYSRV